MLVGYTRQRVQAAASPTCQNYTFHLPSISPVSSEQAFVLPGWLIIAGNKSDRNQTLRRHSSAIAHGNPRTKECTFHANSRNTGLSCAFDSFVYNSTQCERGLVTAAGVPRPFGWKNNPQACPLAFTLGTRRGSARRLGGDLDSDSTTGKPREGRMVRDLYQYRGRNRRSLFIQRKLPTAKSGDRPKR